MGWRLEIARSEPFSRTKHDLKPGSWADTAFPRGQVNDPSFWGGRGKEGLSAPGEGQAAPGPGIPDLEEASTALQARGPSHSGESRSKGLCS